MNGVQPAHDFDAYAAACLVPPRPKYRTVDLVVMCACALIGGCALLGFLLGALGVVYVLATQGHAYSGVGLITCILFAAPCLVVAAIVLPGAMPPGLRARAYGCSSALFGVIVVLAFVALNVLW